MYCHKLIADTLDTVTIAHRFVSPANYVKDVWQNFIREMRQAWCMINPFALFLSHHASTDQGSPLMFIELFFHLQSSM